jgi:hypothetical protein
MIVRCLQTNTHGIQSYRNIATQYSVSVPKDDSGTIKVEVSAGDGGGKYPATETGVWELDYDGSRGIPDPSGRVTDMLFRTKEAPGPEFFRLLQFLYSGVRS